MADETDREAGPATPFDLGREVPRDVAGTLRTVVETVRRVARADTASIATLSLEDRLITWRATSGFQSIGDEGVEVVKPLRGEFAERAASSGETFIEIQNLAGDLPESEFPLHSAEGVHDLGIAQLAVRGEVLGLLVVGYRGPHRFTSEERAQLEGLAEMAALALDNARLFETLGTAKRVWEQTFDAIPDGLIVHDERMLVARCNLAAAEMMGLRPAEVIGLTCADAFARLFGERAAAYHMKQGVGAATSFELQAEDGRRYLVSVAPITKLAADLEKHGRVAESPPPASAPRLAGAHTSWSVITWSDITTLSEIQEQLARSRRLATIGQLAAGVAHEINNPLAAIATCAEATLRDLRARPETAALAEEGRWDYYLEEIVRQTLRCKEITRGLLDLARQRRARRETVDLNALVAQAADLFAARAGAVALDLRLDPSVGEVATDEAMVRQVLDNLLSNALDAVAGGGRVSVSTGLDGGRVSVEIADDGPGIAPDTLARIFDPFFTTKDPGRGSGLGLAISLTLAEALGGALTAESKPGHGSRFRLWLPRRAPEKN
jgi:two-component system, NtrC family, sensor kinase